MEPREGLHGFAQPGIHSIVIKGQQENAQPEDRKDLEPQVNKNVNIKNGKNKKDEVYFVTESSVDSEEVNITVKPTMKKGNTKKQFEQDALS